MSPKPIDQRLRFPPYGFNLMEAFFREHPIFHRPTVFDASGRGGFDSVSDRFKTVPPKACRDPFKRLSGLFEVDCRPKTASLIRGRLNLQPPAAMIPSCEISS
jgi:hypothetical protein